MTMTLDFVTSQLRYDGKTSLHMRLRRLWALVKLLPVDVQHAWGIAAAKNSGLTAALGKHGESGVDHVVRWAVLGRDPFVRKGPVYVD
jgi:hypothetical protein